MKYLLTFGGGDGVIAEGKPCCGGHELVYRSENAPYRLKVTENKIVHECMGEYGLCLAFESGGKSSGRLRMGSSFADYPVVCKHMNVEITPNGFGFTLLFNDGEEEDKKVTAAARLIKDGMGEKR